MASGYDVKWSKRALLKLNKTYIHLEENWTDKEIIILSREIQRTIDLISQNPFIFQATFIKNIRRAVVLKLNSIFYKIDKRKKSVTITAFFSN